MPVQLSRTQLVNQRFADRLGWTPADLGASGFGADLEEAIRGQQRALGVVVDGVFGPVTYAAHQAHLASELDLARAAAPTDLELAGRRALVEARLLWLRGVIDPPTAAPAYAASRAVIDALIRSRDGLGWTWEPPYQHDDNFEWCGTLAAWAWRAAGLALALRKKYFASCYRLDRYGRYAAIDDHPASPRPATDPRRWLRLDQHASPEDAWFDDDDPPRAGDILLVGPAQGNYGKHICLVERFDAAAGTLTTIEGNGTGRLPSGARAHGIVRAQRPIGLGPDEPLTRYHARRLIRPSIHDLGPTASTT